ncbi:hypothetical protein [uncultured Campylobacter sp.]|uniref:hypothetical protein n=1 Tax=uncultured Campylobacter sp. TaxID=218934 RepID=UPI002633D2D0|nr:hypothetical protein [uncultured Campylobacter sp.]
MIKTNNASIINSKILKGFSIFFTICAVWTAICLLWSFKDSTQTQIVVKHSLSPAEAAMNIVGLIKYFPALLGGMLIVFAAHRILQGIREGESSRSGFIMVIGGVLAMSTSFLLDGIIGDGGRSSMPEPTTTEKVEENVFLFKLYFANFKTMFGASISTLIKVAIAMKISIVLFTAYEIVRLKNLEYLAKRYIKEFKKHEGDLNKLTIFKADKWVDPKEMGRNLAKYFV